MGTSTLRCPIYGNIYENMLSGLFDEPANQSFSMEGAGVAWSTFQVDWIHLSGVERVQSWPANFTCYAFGNSVSDQDLLVSQRSRTEVRDL